MVPIVNFSCLGTLCSVISISCRIHTILGPAPLAWPSLDAITLA